MTIRVLTWNVLYREIDDRVDDLCSWMQRVQPSVVLLQETNPEHARQVAARMGMRVTALAPADGASAVVSVPAILTALPVVDSAAVPLSTAGTRPTWLVHADLTANGRTLRVATAHLQHTDLAGRMTVDAGYRRVADGAEITMLQDDQLRSSVATRLRELQLIRSALGPLDSPIILGGDFNFVPDGIEYRRVLSWSLADSWRAGSRLGSGATILQRNPLCSDDALSYQRVAAELLPGFGGSLDYTLDFVFHGSALSVGNAWTVGEPSGGETWASDHLGIAVDYEFRG